jgi:hypothetical protein
MDGLLERYTAKRSTGYPKSTTSPTTDSGMNVYQADTAIYSPTAPNKVQSTYKAGADAYTYDPVMADATHADTTLLVMLILMMQRK